MGNEFYPFLTIVTTLALFDDQAFFRTNSRRRLESLFSANHGQFITAGALSKPI